MNGLAMMARDVTALVDRLGLPAVEVVGSSMGAVTTAKLLALGVPQPRSAVLAMVGEALRAICLDLHVEP